MALKLVSERTLINEIIAGMKAGDTTGKLPANFAKLVWVDIGVRPQDSAVLKVAVFARVVAAANQPAAATADERLLLASVVEQIRQFRIFMAQDAHNAYKSWATNETYRKTVYASSAVAQSFDLGEIPPDFEEITAETILGSMVASGGSSTAIALALTPQAMRAKLFPYAFRAVHQFAKPAVSTSLTNPRSFRPQSVGISLESAKLVHVYGRLPLTAGYRTVTLHALGFPSSRTLEFR